MISVKKKKKKLHLIYTEQTKVVELTVGAKLSDVDDTI